MSRFAIAVAALAVVALAAENVTDVFEQWMAEHGKTYTGEERAERMAIFERNYHRIREENAENLGYTMKINRYADMTEEEVEQGFGSRETPKDDALIGLDEYHEFDDIMAWLHDLGSSHATLASVVTLGDTHENRTVKGLRVGGGGDSQKPVIFIMCGIHGFKWISPASCVYVIDSLVRKYGTDANITSTVDAFEWHIFPVTNADGYAYTWSESGDRNWRKTRRPQAAGCVGADPNRNFDVRWCEDRYGDMCWNSQFCGDHPFSEPAAENIRRYVEDLRKNNRDIKGFLDIHAGYQSWLWPYGYSTGPAPNEAALAQCGNGAVAALEGVNGTVYQTGSIAQTHYEVTGTAVDWAYETGAPHAYIVELRDASGGRGAPKDPPTDQIVPIGEELLNGLTAMATCMARDDGQATTMINGNERKMVLASFLVAAAMPLVQALQ